MEYLKLKDVADIYLGLTHTPKYVDSGIPFLSVKDISGGIIDFSNCHYITEEEYNTLPKGAKPECGDMLFCRVGTIGKPIIIEENVPKFGSFVSLGFLRRKNNEILLNYLKYWMNSNLFYKQVKQNVKGVAQINLNTAWLKEFDIPKVSLKEQKNIVDKLSKVDKMICIKKNEIEKLNQLIKSQFVEMFGDLLSNEIKYDKYKLEEVANIGSSKRIYANEYVTDGIPFYRSKEVIELGHNKKPSVELFITEERYQEVKEKYGVPKKGDILITAVGTIGETWIIDSDKPFYYKDGNLLLISLKKEMSEVFFKFSLDILVDDFKKKNISGSSYGALTIEKFKNMNIVYPPIELQNKFAQIVEQIDKQKFVNLKIFQLLGKKLKK